MSEQAYTDALVMLSSKMDSLVARADKRQDEILAAVNRINGYVREHGETLASHDARIASEKEAREAQDRRLHALSNRVWALGGGSGVLAGVALLLQAMGW